MPVNLLDIAKMNNDDGVIPMVEETIIKVPELTVLPAMDIPGQSFESLVRTANPQVGFRNANEGVATVQSTWENRVVSTAIVDASVEADIAVINSNRRGQADFFAKESVGLLRGAWKSLASQLWYGTATAVATSSALQPSKGFAGAIEAVNSGRVQDATGTGNAASSVWFVRIGETFVQWVFGQDGRIMVEDPTKVRLTDGSGNPYDGMRMPLMAYIGAQFVNPNDSLIRIKNLTTASGKGLTDALLSQAWDLTDAADPSEWACFMTKRSKGQLQRSRTATNATGTPAPTPTETVDGVPIYTTNGLSNAETAA